MSVTLEDLEARVCVLERLVGDSGETTFSPGDAFKDVRSRITTLQLRVMSMRHQLEELVDDGSANKDQLLGLRHDMSDQGVAIAAIASHLGVAVPEEEAKP
ncbi:hypothetical protein ACQPW1_32875 [Nocardia sp. CA-128927]|uniref:hypothetical protein n=1 Tax=Nocardia sp. CA-128927 TaxID=3239975 RepID=UPI003D96DAC1